MFKLYYLVQSLDTGEWIADFNGEVTFTFDFEKAYRFKNVNDAISHIRVFDLDFEKISVISQVEL